MVKHSASLEPEGSWIWSWGFVSGGLSTTTVNVSSLPTGRSPDAGRFQEADVVAQLSAERPAPPPPPLTGFALAVAPHGHRRLLQVSLADITVSSRGPETVTLHEYLFISKETFRRSIPQPFACF